MKPAFIIIDDSELDCFIIQKIIQHIDSNFNFKIYRSAQKALDALKKVTEEDYVFGLIVLDINMPMMNGFEFIEAFEKLPSGIKDKYRIVVLSSTRNPGDIARLSTYKSVESFIDKPITKEKLYALLARTDVEA
ncbi:response regulator [Mucilaginibacter sp. PAMB04274]|uniref:response regulator n=1 Tax=Mucilaginibacter sp. PAMB04274 TaxID=3138568 RepID=UPI0031F6E2CF